MQRVTRVWLCLGDNLSEMEGSIGLLLLLLHYHYIHLTAFFSRTTWVSRHRKGKPFWILLEQDMMWWQWHQLDHMQIICTSLQTDNHASISPLSFFSDRMLFLPPNQQRPSTEEKLACCCVETLFFRDLLIG